MLLTASKISISKEENGLTASGADAMENNRPSLNFGLCAVVYEWARGTSFKEITEMTLVHEGLLNCTFFLSYFLSLICLSLELIFYFFILFFP